MGAGPERRAAKSSPAGQESCLFIIILSFLRSDFKKNISLECNVRVPKDDPVRLLSAVLDRIDYRRINAAYSRLGRNEYPTRLLTKVWANGYMRRMIHTREVEAACRENLKFMYLLEGHKVPDHNTLARFRSRILTSI